MQAPSLSPTPPAPAPMPAPPPAPGIAANGGGAKMSRSPAAKMPSPGATSSFKIGSIKLAFTPYMRPPPRVGVANAVVDTGKNYLEGLGDYTADVINENDKKTQRPNDPSLITHHLGRSIV